jgi:hypothetical protein
VKGKYGKFRISYIKIVYFEIALPPWWARSRVKEVYIAEERIFPNVSPV